MAMLSGCTRGCTREAPRTHHPVPEAKGVVGVDSEFLDELEVGGDSHHVLGDSLVAKRLGDPLAHGARVEHGLGGGERLGDDDDEGGLGALALEGTRYVLRVDVCEEGERAAVGGHLALGLGLERGVDKGRAEEGAPDADADDVGELLACGAHPLAAADELAELGDLIENGVDLKEGGGGVITGEPRPVAPRRVGRSSAEEPRAEGAERSAESASRELRSR